MKDSLEESASFNLFRGSDSPVYSKTVEFSFPGPKQFVVTFQVFKDFVLTQTSYKIYWQNKFLVKEKLSTRRRPESLQLPDMYNLNCWISGMVTGVLSRLSWLRSAESKMWYFLKRSTCLRSVTCQIWGQPPCLVVPSWASYRARDHTTLLTHASRKAQSGKKKTGLSAA